ncbi:MAG TPA: NADH-quinone oxidoreductase subunit C [bacterium]|nr:NADH-quinone oxidoreductase subunit C [bacterium]
MSWALAERLRDRFPEVELFPRPGEEEPPAGAPEDSGTGPARPAVRRPAHDAPPAYLTPGVIVPRERLLDVCRVLAREPGFGLHYLSFVSAIDQIAAGQFEVLYHLYSMETKEELVLKVRLPRERPALPSVTGIWDGANWHERETYDLFGIVFEGHPNLRRILMTEDWIGHPLRKDYVYQDPPWLVEAAKQRQKDLEGLGLGERA